MSSPSSLDKRVAAWLAKGNDKNKVKKKPAGAKIKKRPAGATSPSPAQSPTSGTAGRIGRALLNWRPPRMEVRGVLRSDAIALQESYGNRMADALLAAGHFALPEAASRPDAAVIVDPETDDKIQQELEEALSRSANDKNDNDVIVDPETDATIMQQLEAALSRLANDNGGDDNDNNENDNEA